MRPTKPVPMRGRGRARTTTVVKSEEVFQSQQVEVPVSCEICHKVMMTGKTLVQHMAIHSDMKPFQCPHCPKSFARKVHLQGHLVIHGIEKQFECPVCHQRFSRQDCVKVHMRLHDKSQCVYCDVCHKAFLTVGALNIHLRIHRGEKPFKCHLCSKCFTQKNHLITHIKRHTKVADEHFTKKLGPRMFKCEHCSRAFIRLSDYERHVQWNHGAVADGSIVEKLPTVSNLLDGEMKQTGLAPQIFKAPKDAINKRSHRGGRRGRKVMCTASTQTDEGGGHVIIPRVYQGQVSTSTQVSAPPTPRPADDDMYESDIFDEGMDRNYSSDEDEDDPDEADNSNDKIFTVAATSDTASDPVQDAAFDAIVQGASAKPSSITIEETAAATTTTTTTREATTAAAVTTIITTTTTTAVSPATTVPPPPSSSSSSLMSLAAAPSPPPPPPATSAAPAARAGSTEDVSDHHAVFLQEVVSSLNKRLLDVREPEVAKENNAVLEEERMEIIENEPEETQVASLPESMVPPSRVAAEELGDGDASQEQMFVGGTSFAEERKSPFLFTPSKGRGRGRGQGRGRVARIRKCSHGLSGAAELRFIRKSMMRSIMIASEEKNQNNEAAEDAKPPEVKNVSNAPEDVEVEGRVKRMAKKQHGEDFVCNMKNCETCIPPQRQNVKVQPKMKAKEKESESAEGAHAKRTLEAPEVKPDPTLLSGKLQVVNAKSPKPVLKRLVKSTDKPWITHGSQIDVAKLKESIKTAEVKKKEPSADEVKMKVSNHVGKYPVNITASVLSNKSKVPVLKQDYFVATSKSDSIVSPPVELMSFCIPTYSCKLCGREFRFEGKLHRHIESVHQNKTIFSADVKPGRGSSRYAVPRVNKLEDEPEVPVQESEPENPEIAALRSEWDDDDDDNEDMSPPGGSALAVSSTTAATIPSVSTYPPTHQPITIVTREITPMTTTISGSAYTSGVKVNMNKLTGLLSQVKELPITNTSEIKEDTATRVSASVVPSHHPRESEAIMADTLDMKCRRLLEKLFDHSLLMNCGLMEEHVSVVLGRVLQHYGVKMIEDYGQGQYEVLKYNLWRLIEWKVTMEQMEEFYSAGKSVEEMMDDIMNERVPLVSHHFVPNEQKANPPPQVSQAAPQVSQVETMEMADGQMVLQQVAGVLGGQLNLPEGVTQVVLAQDVSPDLLHGAHIVTIDPATGQVISQVTADQVILTDAIGDDLEQQVAALDGQVVVSQPHMATQAATQESIVVQHNSTIPIHTSQGQVSHGQVVVQATTAAPHQQPLKLETTGVAPARQHHPHQQ